ncbi:unnamed protein product [Spirodela intermedia]|uniref:Uncharacterized protein n=1 Tax=Spirodela intermedia TaxID=51605 RepID=A0A7I8J4C5_SPIIN|nr:unnamed protein product [Spirodela intermedia]CAA6664221.1 unnamed protein product [Spirodela intermedia]
MAICTPSPPPFMARATFDIRSPMEFPQASTPFDHLSSSTMGMVSRRGRLSGISIQWRRFEDEQEGFSPPEFSLQPQREGVDQVEGDEEDGSPDGDLPGGEDEGEGQQRQEEEDDVPDEAPPVDLDPLLRHADGDDAHHHAGDEDGTAENAVHADIAGA